MKLPKLYIKIEVEDGEVIGVWYTDENGQDCLLKEGSDYSLMYFQKRTERCKVCDRTYPASEIVKRDGEQLCEQCDDDKYPIKPEDIPY
jgi:hypothetical protein